MLSNTLKLNTLLTPKNIRILHPHYDLTITGHILKNKHKNKHVCVHEIMQLIKMKMKIKMKIDSRKYGINGPRCRHGHKDSKHMKRLSMMILIQHLSNLWTYVYMNVKQHCGWKKALLIKRACNQATMARIVGHAYTYDKHYITCLKIKSIRIGKRNANRTNKFITKKINWI